MQKGLPIFIRRTYKSLSVIFLIVIFFVVYNTYLVDRSLINLRMALVKATEAKTVEDFEKIKPFLKTPLLKEIFKKKTSNKVLLSMENVENIINTATSERQVEDIKFYLKSVIQTKEKERGAFLAALDTLNSRIFAPTARLPKEGLEAAARGILGKIGAATQRSEIQELYYELGNVYVQLADLPLAEDAFSKAVNIDEESPLALKARFNLAWAYKSMGQYDKAMAAFEELSQEYPEVELAAVTQYQVADTLFKKGQYQEAVEKYAMLAEEYGQTEEAPLALTQAGYISYYNLQDTKEALEYFSELETRFSQSEIKKHIDVETKSTISDEYRKQGFQLIRGKRYTEAIGSFDKAVEVAPSDTRAYSGMGLSFYWLDRKPEALEKAEKSIRVSTLPDEITLINSLFIYINTGEIDKAIQISENALSKTLVPRAEFYYNLGYAYVLKAKMDKAIEQFERTIRINPDFIFAYNNLGCTFWTIGRYAEAIKKFKEAVDRDPAYADAHFNLGIVYFNLNQLENSYKEFQTVLAINPEDEQAREYSKRIVEILQYKP